MAAPVAPLLAINFSPATIKQLGAIVDSSSSQQIAQYLYNKHIMKHSESDELSLIGTRREEGASHLCRTVPTARGGGNGRGRGGGRSVSSIAARLELFPERQSFKQKDK